MKNQIRKRIQIEPIKSPSPDLANRTFIRNTIAPLQQIQKYHQDRSRSSSPKFVNSLIFTNSNNQIDQLKHQNATLKQEVNKLKLQETQNSRLVERNSTLIQQISQLRNQKYNHHFQPLIINEKQSYPFNEKQNILKQFSDRLNRVSDQNKKLVKKLQDQAIKMEFLNKESQMLKSQIIFYKKQPKNNYPIEKTPLNQISKEIQQQVQQTQSSYQQSINQKLLNLELKIDKINVLQNILEQRVQRKKIQSARTDINSSATEYFLNNSSTWRSKVQNLTQPIEMENQKSSNITQKQLQNQYKIQSQKLQNQIINLNKQIDQLKLENQQKKQQIKTLLQNNNELSNKSLLQSQKKQKQINSIKQSQLVFLKQKITYLQKDIKCKLNTISNLEEQCNIKQKQCSLTKKRLEQTNYLMQHQMGNFQKFIEQQKSKNSIYQSKIKQLQQQLSLHQNRKSIQLKNHQQQSIKIQKYLKDIQSLSEQINNKDRLLANVLKQYLQFTKQIKQTILYDKFNQIITTAHKYQNNFATLQQLAKENSNIICQLKTKLIRRQQTIIELQGANKVLKVQNQQLLQQKNKLKNVIQSYSIKQIKQKNIPQFNCQLVISQNIKECIEQTICYISKLQNKMNSHLEQLNILVQ